MRRGVASPGRARLGRTRWGRAGHGQAWLPEAGPGAARQGEARPGGAWPGKAWLPSARRDQARRGETWRGTARMDKTVLGRARLPKARHGWAWSGVARCGKARPGLDRHGFQGFPRSTQERPLKPLLHLQPPISGGRKEGTVKVALMADGRTPLIMHNERLADPLDEYTRAIAKIAKKRGKTDSDHLEIGRLEFLGGMYANGNGPCLPATNILRCLQGAAKRTKRGADVLRGVAPLLPHADLAYEGPREADEMWKTGGYSLRKSVGVQRARTMRTRPIFEAWSVVLPVEVDPTIFDPDVLAAIWKDAGVYEGLGEMRPIYGRFAGSLTEWTIRTDDGLGEAAYALASAVAAKHIQLEDGGRLERHGVVEETIREAVKKAKALTKRANGAS